MAVHPFQAQQVLGQSTTTQTVSTTETTLYTTNLYAQAFVVNLSAVRILGWGHTINNANAKTLTVYFGGTSHAFTLRTSTAANFIVEGYIMSDGNGGQNGYVTVIHGDASASTSEVYTFQATENNNADIILKVTGTGGATGDIILYGVTVLV